MFEERKIKIVFWVLLITALIMSLVGLSLETQVNELKTEINMLETQINQLETQNNIRNNIK